MKQTRFMLPGGIYDAIENVHIKPLLVLVCQIEYVSKHWTCFNKNPTTKIHFNIILFRTTSNL
jgi:hypothetical protein